MNITEARERAGELLGKIYWHERGPFLIEDPEEEKNIRTEYAKLSEKLNRGEFPPETNKRGNLVFRGFDVHGDPYKYHNILTDGNANWSEVDCQPGEVSGIWVNSEEMCLFYYTEGDLTLTLCLDEESYIDELLVVDAFYRDLGLPIFDNKPER